jgi:phage-related protein
MAYSIEYFNPRVKQAIEQWPVSYLVDQKIVILHALIKKTRMTPTQGLAIARSRMKAVKHG